MTRDELLVLYLVFSSVAMICVAVVGYLVAKVVSEIYASKKQVATEAVRRGSRAGPVWEVNGDGTGCEETEGDGDETTWGIP